MKDALKTVLLTCALAVILSSCRKAEPDPPAEKPESATDATKATTDAHAHGDDCTHEDQGAAHEEAEEQGHEHNEVPLGTVAIGDMQIELAQGHGKVEAGKEGHLVIKLPHNDKGATTVRAWIGTEDRLKSLVAKAEYAPSHDDYDVHVGAPDPLPEGVMWWIEIQKPDGKKVVGSAKPLMD